MNKILKEKGLTELEWDFKGLQDFYESFSFKQDFYVSKINNIKVISKNTMDNIFKLVVSNTNKIIANSGLFSLEECMNLKDVYLNNIKKETIKKILQTKPQFSWLGQGQNFFTYFAKRNRLSNLISKVSKTSKIIDINLLYEKIKNHHRIENKVVYNKEILIDFCKVSFDCELDDKSLLIFHKPDSKISDFDGYRGNIIAPNEEKLLSIFRDYGPILGIDDIKDLAEKNDIKQDSLI